MATAEVVTTEINCVTLLETILRKKNILMTYKCAITNLPSRVITQKIISMDIFSLLKLNQQQNEAKSYKLKQDSFIQNFQYMKYNTDSSSMVYEYHRLCLRKEALEYKCTVLERLLLKKHFFLSIHMNPGEQNRNIGRKLLPVLSLRLWFMILILTILRGDDVSCPVIVYFFPEAYTVLHFIKQTHHC